MWLPFGGRDVERMKMPSLSYFLLVWRGRKEFVSLVSWVSFSRSQRRNRDTPPQETGLVRIRNSCFFKWCSIFKWSSGRIKTHLFERSVFGPAEYRSTSVQLLPPRPPGTTLLLFEAPFVSTVGPTTVFGRPFPVLISPPEYEPLNATSWLQPR